MAAPNFSSSVVTGPNKVAYLMLKHLLLSAIDFFHIFNLSWSSHSFPSIWKTSIVLIYELEKPLDFMLFFSLSLLPPVSESFLNASFLSHLLFSLMSNSVLSTRPGQFLPWAVYSQSNSVPFSVYFRWV